MKSSKIRLINEDDLYNLQLIKPELSEETFRNRLELQKRLEISVLILEVNKKPVASVVVKWKGKPSQQEYPDVEDLYTRESERKKGYGSALLKECERLAKSRGFSKIGLAVNPDHNESAHNLYRTLGYKDVNSVKYLDGTYNGVEDWVIDMEKELL